MRGMPKGLMIFGLFLTMGCGAPSPSELCKKLDKLEVRSKKGKKKSAAARKKERERCVKDMTKLKKDNPKAYKCVARCAKEDDYDAAMLCTVGCIMKHTPRKDFKAARKSAKKDMDALCKTDWSDLALHPVTDTVDGLGFSVQIPKGLKREVKKGSGGFPGYVTWSEKGMCGPGFTVQEAAFPPSSLESISTIMPNKKILKKKVVPGGFLVVTGEKGDRYLEVKIYRKNKAGKTLGFSMTQRSDKLPAVLKKQQAWLEKVALTFQAK